MTLASDIITRGYRESNLIPAVASPNTTQVNEALPLLNTAILSSVGFEAGEELHDLNIGGSYDQSQYVSQWVPDNSRLVLNLGGARTLYLHPQPYSGQRVAIVDTAGNLASNNLILNGNGRQIEAAATVTLSTNGMNRQWLYRGDTGNWVKITSLASGDTMPFPEEFDDYFTIMLAKRLNPRYGQSLSQESRDELGRQKSLIQARYRRPRRQQDIGTLGLLGQRDMGWPNETGLYR